MFLMKSGESGKGCTAAVVQKGKRGGISDVNVPATGQTLSGHHHLSLKREGRWGTTDNFATSFVHFSLFSTALWDFDGSLIMVKTNG